MLTRPISMDEARKVVMGYLHEGKKTRSKDIRSLNLAQVTCYIEMAKIMWKELPEIEKEREKFKKTLDEVDWLHATSFERSKSYKGYTFNYTIHSHLGFRWSYTYNIHPHYPSTDDFNELLWELAQRKLTIENLNSHTDTILRNMGIRHLNASLPAAQQPFTKDANGSLDEDEKKDETSFQAYAQLTPQIKDAQDRVALEVLQGYDQLLGEHQSICQQNKELTAKDQEKKAILEKTLEENKKLNNDIQTLKTQLAQSDQYNTKLITEMARLKKEKQKAMVAVTTYSKNIETLQAELTALKATDVMKENKQLRECLQKDKEAYKKQLIDLQENNKPLKMRRATLTKYLQELDENKTRLKLFSPNSRNKTRENLKQLSEKSINHISFEQIARCIVDPLLLEIFMNSNGAHDTKETRTVRLIKKLGVFFETQKDEIRELTTTVPQKPA